MVMKNDNTSKPDCDTGGSSPDCNPPRVSQLTGWICPACGAVNGPHVSSCPNCAPPLKVTCVICDPLGIYYM